MDRAAGSSHRYASRRRTLDPDSRQNTVRRQRAAAGGTATWRSKKIRRGERHRTEIDHRGLRSSTPGPSASTRCRSDFRRRRRRRDTGSGRRRTSPVSTSRPDRAGCSTSAQPETPSWTHRSQLLAIHKGSSTDLRGTWPNAE